MPLDPALDAIGQTHADPIVRLSNRVADLERAAGYARDATPYLPAVLNAPWWRDYSLTGFPQWGPVSYCIDAAGWVHLSGLVQSVRAYSYGTPASVVLFELPIGFRPVFDQLSTQWTAINGRGRGIVRVDVNRAGQVYIAEDIVVPVGGTNTGDLLALSLNQIPAFRPAAT